MITGWPIYANTKYIVKNLLLPLVKMLVTQRDDGFVESFRKTLEGTLYVNAFDSNGKNIYDVRVKKYPYSVAKCSDEEKSEIYGNVPLETLTKTAGEDHLYYFAYNSFGNNGEITDELYDFIAKVKRETGHDKINIAAISLGGTIANSLFDRYPELYASLDRVVYIRPRARRLQHSRRYIYRQAQHLRRDALQEAAPEACRRRGGLSAQRRYKAHTQTDTSRHARCDR